jgi:hypothetical protein
VFLPHEDDLREAIGRIAKFLEAYRRSHGTHDAQAASPKTANTEVHPKAIKLVATRV